MLTSAIRYCSALANIHVLPALLGLVNVSFQNLLPRRKTTSALSPETSCTNLQGESFVHSSCLGTKIQLPKSLTTAMECQKTPSPRTKRQSKALAVYYKMAADVCVSSSCPRSSQRISLMWRPVYVGDSASLSFLQSIRRLVEGSLGTSPFTMDSNRHKILEASISTPPGYQHTYALPDLEASRYLTDSFFDNVSISSGRCCWIRPFKLSQN